ncbi:MAG: hypothetical protein HY696_02910 [Deltaproteobacteria bacterium]|nr:hypothetical protein [Deltaproteobacteria bacterium]
MALSQLESQLVFDKRLVDRNLRQGHVTEADLNKQLAALPDLAAEAETLPPYDELRPEEQPPATGVNVGPMFEAAE